MPDEPITLTRDVDWLRSVTQTRTERKPSTMDTGGQNEVQHTAYFGIRPGALMDVLPDYSTTQSFRPELVTVKWRDGDLVHVELSGSLRLKDGGVSDKVNRHRTWRSWAAHLPVVTEELPGQLGAALDAYAAAVDIAGTGARR